MKLRKNINRIAMLINLLMINTNAKGFYQCVPKENWFKNQYDMLMLEDKFKVAKTQIDNEHAWELVSSNNTSGSLPIGVYKVIVKGGDGGASGRSQNGGDGGNSSYYGDNTGKTGSYVSFNSGSLGEEQKRVFFIKSITSYTSCFGRKGSSGGNGTGGKGGNGGTVINPASYGMGGGGGGGGAGTGGQGGGGAGGYFKIKNISISVRGGIGGKPLAVVGGKGGKSSQMPFSGSKHGSDAGDVSDVYYSGLGTGGYGCNSGSNGSIGKISNGAEGGAGCFKSLICDDYHGKKGSDGIAGSGGSGGALMNSSQSSDSGDGYVRIYKYIG